MSRQQEKHRWYGMLYRCENPRSPAYSRYGGRGIKVHESWHDFETYYADLMESLGLCPDPQMSLDRIDNDGNYAPGNVRWATIWQQQLNRSPRSPRPRTPCAPMHVARIARAPYLQIADQLRAGIAAGDYDSTGQLPTLFELMDEISPRPGYNTVRKAIKVLLDEGLVETSPRGTFVARRGGT